MSPFDVMAKALTVPPKLEPQPKFQGKAVDALVALLSDGHKRRTTELASAIGLTHTRLVWGLLKDRRRLGQVIYAEGLWWLDPSYTSQKVALAADLLRRHGWKVEPPAC